MGTPALKEYEALTGVKINPYKSVGLQLGACSDKFMPSNSVVRCWAGGPVEILAGLVRSIHSGGQELERGDDQDSQNHPKIG